MKAMYRDRDIRYDKGSDVIMGNVLFKQRGQEKTSEWVRNGHVV